MNAGGCGYKGIGLPAQRPRKDRGQQGENVERDEPHGQVLAQEVGHEGNALALTGGLVIFAGRAGVAVALDKPQMKRKQRQEQGRQHHDVQSEETLHGELADLRTAAQHVGDGRTDERNCHRNLQADLGGKVAELIHGQQVAGEAEDRGDAEKHHAAEPAELTRLAVGLHEED